MERLDRLEAVQSMLLEIGQLSTSCSDIVEFIAAVHRALGRIMYAANFYVALSDQEDGSVRFVYFVDEEDETPDAFERITLAAPAAVARAAAGDLCPPRPAGWAAGRRWPPRGARHAAAIYGGESLSVRTGCSNRAIR